MKKIRLEILDFIKKNGKNPFDPKSDAFFEFEIQRNGHPRNWVNFCGIVVKNIKTPPEVLDHLAEAKPLEEMFPINWSRHVIDAVAKI